MKAKKVLVYGFYSKSNIGDQLFVEAFKHLFPNYHFTFSDNITEELIANKDAIFFGGGSFLDGEPHIPQTLVHELKKLKIFYLGIGAETSIHPWHKYLLKNASLIAARSLESYDRLKELNDKTMFCPDLVYCLSDQVAKRKKTEKSILFLPNSHTISKWNSMAWKHTAWEFFKSECAQAFEDLTGAGYKIDVLPMCENSHHRDSYNAIEIAAKMNNGDLKFLPFQEHSFSELSKLVSGYEIIISQRYHGLILADMVGSSSVNLHHHDKLKHFSGPLNKNVNFYQCSKDSLLNAVDCARFKADLQLSDNDSTVINSNIFKSLQEQVKQIISKD